MSEEVSEIQKRLEKLKSWMIILVMVFGILAYGLLVYVTVGDKGPPGWRFGALKDVPAESPFSTERAK